MRGRACVLDENNDPVVVENVAFVDFKGLGTVLYILYNTYNLYNGYQAVVGSGRGVASSIDC